MLGPVRTPIPYPFLVQQPSNDQINTPELSSPYYTVVTGAEMPESALDAKALESQKRDVLNETGIGKQPKLVTKIRWEGIA